MNKIQLCGRTTKEPELRFLNSGTAICNFTMAVRREFKDKESGNYESDFFNCKAFGKTGELIGEFVKKGALFPIWGKVQNGSYTNKDGVKIYTTEIIVDGFDFPPKNENSHYAPGGEETKPSASSFGHQVSMDSDIHF